MRHSPDRERGGYYHCLDRDGSVICTDKYMWLENRQIWTFAWFYNRLEKRPEWLGLAKLGADFLKAHGRDGNGDWYFALTETGQPLVQPYNIFSDCFAVIAFAEYARASGDQEALELAIRTYRRIQERQANPKGRYNKQVPGVRPLENLAFPMINLNISRILNEVRPNPVYSRVIEQSLDRIMNRFLDPECRVVHENLTPEGRRRDDIYEGRHLIPGHGLEAMWFVMEAAAGAKDWSTVRRAAEGVKWCLEKGWDREYGGIYYFLDRLDRPHFELQWDMKLWWPHLEALVATLLGYRLTGDPELLDWFRKVHEYAWRVFPDPEYGEWFGYANRRGEVNNRCKGGRFKGCFHLPRALYLVTELCRELADTSAGTGQNG